MKRFYRVLCVFLLILAIAPVIAADLVEYVNRPDESFQFEVVETRSITEGTVTIASLTSQTWQDIPWRHWLAIITPKEVSYPDNMALVIGGGSIRETPPGLDGGEARVAIQVAAATKSAIALLTQVPNQPLFGDLREDHLIAYTYDKYLKGEGDDWPLLLPMAKSAVKAMDAVQHIMREQFEQEVKGFLLTGGSKRGWTSWLAAASGDPRVIAIAPVVIDMLNIEPQMQRQMECYGQYSNQIDEYTELDLQRRMRSQDGKKLQAMVDPYSYRDKLTMPKMMILGTNDPYWTVDAANFYFPGLVGEKHLIYQPNTGHDATINGISALSHFFYALQQGKSYPAISWEKPEPNKLAVTWQRPGGKAYLWKAVSDTRDFREAFWMSSILEGDGRV
ncbi:MAG TPA: hypothetical protein ENN29_10970, partial [Candidatus Hydrogenedentes bacterium]|nr:hypothetical protein [Candidatus Hydrogenedentota bacterium]